MKTMITIATIVILSIISSASAHAGRSSDRHHIEKFVAGTGAILLGSAIIHELNRDRDRRHGYRRDHRRGHRGKHVNSHRGYRRSYRDRHYRDRNYRDRHHRDRHYRDRHHRNWRHGRSPQHSRGGHWTVKKVWVPGIH